MKTIAALCNPKATVFDASQRDTVHDILDLKNKTINPELFFDETYFTGGMKSLIKNAFERLSGKGSESVFRLSQSMGGGKTHSMIALGLLAELPELRKRIFPDAAFDGESRLVVISGRMKMRNCLWGEVAEQLGNLKAFGSLISPPEAPSQEEWVELLDGKPTILLFDELAPYLEGAAGKTVGGTTLAGITTIAIANLLNAVSSNKLPNCVAVFSDLSSSAHASGGQAVNSAFQKAAQDTGQEIDRFARVLEPVQINTDEFYKILRKRIFDNEPDKSEVEQVALSYSNFTTVRL
jgi:predicted AAA+ superfamily ATPase